ncbi:Holliday junction resolvase RuvX [Shouchella clausii]|uniref:Putative pre-16S rRNA nuclease n=1 Tax=Shouchella clausii TaxID=79880 RepID=A0A268S4S4_SHOCL|nr:Holliday junction resolvase RuvX [Shouchella clausii]PAD43686.1 Holliday junction resolvase RuvX [Bacillus sp. 7520-S]AST98176.1 Holliday junction resolvase RuvX [Shouchella clausii]MBU8595272.1 Holliday junction resolvase RuvX [Shouchella clausii]MCR1286977.1 Holliday junction resolvase RuvX [Shouchella clausii]MCY1103330.1 Holliday junction resolvase RuvX [Shouchella clausii]
MKTIGLDVGTKTIGVAISDAFGWTAQGLPTIQRSEDDPNRDFEALAELIKENDVQKVVIGYPKNMNGTVGESATRSEAFARTLEQRCNVQAVLWDERLTTAAAQRVLIDADVSRKKRKKAVDKMAAVFILQGYLDRQSHTLT